MNTIRRSRVSKRNVSQYYLSSKQTKNVSKFNILISSGMWVYTKNKDVSTFFQDKYWKTIAHITTIQYLLYEKCWTFSNSHVVSKDISSSEPTTKQLLYIFSSMHTYLYLEDTFSSTTSMSVCISGTSYSFKITMHRLNWHLRRGKVCIVKFLWSKYRYFRYWLYCRHRLRNV